MRGDVYCSLLVTFGNVFSDLADEGHFDVLNHHLLLLLLILPQKAEWQGTAGCPPSVFNVVVAAVHPSTVVLKGRLDEEVDILLDSGSTISLVHNSIMPRTLGVKQLSPGDLQMVSSAGESMPVVGHAKVVLQVGQLNVEHPLVVVDSLISPVIIGVDFLQQDGLVQDFVSSPISVTTRHTAPSSHGQLQDTHAIVEDIQKAKICA